MISINYKRKESSHNRAVFRLISWQFLKLLNLLIKYFQYAFVRIKRIKIIIDN